MVSGLLMEMEDHNCWTLAEALGHSGPHILQHLLSRAVWDDERVLERPAAWAAKRLDDGEAVLIIDETAGAKSSTDAAGAARQYSGTWGGIGLCQVAVTLTFASGRGHALIDRALYLPEGCVAEAVTSVSSSSGPRRTASSTAVHEVRPGSRAAMTEYGQPGIICAWPFPRP